MEPHSRPPETESGRSVSDDGKAMSLHALRPRLPLWRRGARVLLFLLCLAVLAAAYRASEVSPGLLWTNRWKAVEFVFGRELSEQQLADAKAQAERFPELLASQRAREEVRAEYTSRGDPLPPESALGREVRAQTTKLLEEQTAQERARIVEQEFQRQVTSARGGFFPPEIRAEKLKQYAMSLGETLAIALWGTLLAVVGALPFALLASPRTLNILAPGDSWWHAVLRWTSRFIVRRFLDGCRGFNEFVLALIIVAIIGLGPFTGVLALFVHSLGILGKVFSEAIDAMDQGPVEGVSSTGARPLQVVVFAVLPQIMPYLVSNSLLRFETNVRSATILGVVGAGGIGFLMSDKINGYQFREVCTMMIIVILAVSVIDLLCTRLMRAVV
jgi:phosphonate transport system permease protein